MRVRASSWAVVLGWVALGCNRSPSSEGTAASAAPVRRAEDADGDEVVRMLAGLYQPVGSVHSAVERARDCQQKSVGFEVLAGCLERTVQHARGVARQVPATLTAATTPCAMSVEKAERELLAAAPAYLEQLAQAVRSREAELSKGLASKTLAQLCADRATPQGCAWLVGEPAAAALTSVTGVSCVAQLFQCGPAEGACGVPEVAARLGLQQPPERNLVDGSPGSVLRVRASQRVVAPLRR